MQKNITIRTRHFDESILKKVSGHPLLTMEQELELVNRTKAGDEKALEELCNANSRFVVAVALQFLDRGKTLDELIEIGNKGLELAAKRYKPQSGFKFMSYAIWWIRQCIIKA